MYYKIQESLCVITIGSIPTFLRIYTFAIVSIQYCLHHSSCYSESYKSIAVFEFKCELRTKLRVEIFRECCCDATNNKHSCYIVFIRITHV